MDIIDVLKRHTNNSFESIEILFNTFNKNDFEKSVNGFYIWQQFYHMINSMCTAHAELALFRASI